eukprot:TRINITY_DN2069_c0_g1_i5.p1 TRINITY_DN2069_c0_g1~~TRINITY_DN2069_c0_g1_i5.p1  ORF type:complete len:306 (+),score=46.87 TRINITY_DN2069_c0_g1_i5:142-1059(+)
MIRRPPRSTLSSSSAASDVYKRQEYGGAEAGMVVQGNGTWMGHLFPAMVLLATGTWWGTAALHRNRGRTPLYPPYGAGLSCLLSCVGMVPDLLLSFTSPSPLRLDHLVHFSLYLLFFGAGTVAWHERERRLPSGTAHTVLGFVFLLEALILVSHRFNSDLERLAHQLLAGLAAGTGLSLLGEVAVDTGSRAIRLLGFTRALFTCSQGSWFVTITLVFWTPAVPDFLTNEPAGLVLLFCWQFLGMLCLPPLLYGCWAAPEDCGDGLLEDFLEAESFLPTVRGKYDREGIEMEWHVLESDPHPETGS